MNYDKNKNHKSAVILCGGKGTRLGSIGKKIPKTLMMVQGKPILWYIIKVLKKNKYNQIVLALGYKQKKIINYLSKNKNEFKDINIKCVNTGVNSSISQRIYLLRNAIHSYDFLLLNSDTIFNLNLNKIYKDKIKKKIDLVFLTVSAIADFGCVIMNKKKVIGFERETTFKKIYYKKKKFTGLVNSGICFMNKKIFNYDFKNFNNFEMQLYPILIKKLKTSVVTPKGFWTGVDNQKQIDDLNSKKKNNYINIKNIKSILKKI